MEELARESCLLQNQSGMQEAVPLTEQEVQKALSTTREIRASVHIDLDIYDYWQAQAASPASRSKADIDTIVLHTPEGGVSGTLGVLNGAGAGFDWFLPPSGELYKCNDYYNYIAWQAGDWNYNERSIGIEQWNYASTMHTAPESHYNRLARLCAYLVETLDLAIRHAQNYGEYGFIYHRTVTPGARCDPDACGQSSFNMEMLLQKVADLVQGKPAPAPAPTPSKYVYRTVVASTIDAEIAKKNQEAARQRGFKDAWTLRTEKGDK